MKTVRLFFIMILIGMQYTLAQESRPKFLIDYNEMKGELTLNDLFKKDLGRYDGYEIELFEGEAVNFVAYTQNFQPKLALVNPKGEVFLQSAMNDKGFANIVSIVPSSGNWILYLVGDENSRGSYTLQISIGEPNSLSLPNDSEFCTTLEYLIAHAYAYFFLLENPSLVKQQMVKLNDALDAFLDEDNGAYNAFYYNGNEKTQAEEEFKKISGKINFCLMNDWQTKTSDWEKVEGYREKSITYTEKTEKAPRYIIVSIYEWDNTDKKHQGKYTVTVEINRLR